MAKTVLELTPKELGKYSPQRQRVRGWPQPLRRRAWQVAREVAHKLRQDFGARRVVVFGSLAHQLWHSPQSDIDIAAWGIAPQDYLKAYMAVNDLGAGFEVNLVDPKDCFPSVRASIRKHGVEI